jgi:uncharacterized coiled-coil protein SlyX
MMSLSQESRITELEQQLAVAESDGDKMAARIAELEAKLAAVEKIREQPRRVVIDDWRGSYTAMFTEGICVTKHVPVGDSLIDALAALVEEESASKGGAE